MEQPHSAENRKWGTFVIFNIHFVAEYQKKLKEDVYVGRSLQILETMSHSAEKKSNVGPFSLVRFCMLRSKK